MALASAALRKAASRSGAMPGTGNPEAGSPAAGVEAGPGGERRPRHGHRRASRQASSARGRCPSGAGSMTRRCRLSPPTVRSYERHASRDRRNAHATPELLSLGACPLRSLFGKNCSVAYYGLFLENTKRTFRLCSEAAASAATVIRTSAVCSCVLVYRRRSFLNRPYRARPWAGIL